MKTPEQLLFQNRDKVANYEGEAADLALDLCQVKTSRRPHVKRVLEVYELLVSQNQLKKEVETND